MFPEYLAMAIVVVAWGSYPLMARSAGAGGPAGALVLTLFGLVPISAAFLWQGDSIKLTQAQWLKLLSAGLTMGAGTTAFNFVVNSRKLEASVSVPIVDAAMIVVSVIGALLFFAEPLNGRKLMGVALIVLGIVVLKPD